MSKLEKLVIATRNPGKLERYREMLGQFASTILGLNDLGIEGKPEETGNTAEENAQVKAGFYCQKTKLPVFCEDEFLQTDFQPEEKQPGVHVRRINGRDEVSDEELLKYWEQIVARVPPEKRTGRWHFAYCLAMPDGRVKTVTTDHEVLFFSPSSKIQIPGFPMSSLQGSVRFGKPSSEHTAEEKAISYKLIAEELAEKFAELIQS